jgi:hypothetical protein
MEVSGQPAALPPRKGREDKLLLKFSCATSFHDLVNALLPAKFHHGEV